MRAHGVLAIRAARAERLAVMASPSQLLHWIPSRVDMTAATTPMRADSAVTTIHCTGGVTALSPVYQAADIQHDAKQEMTKTWDFVGSWIIARG